MPYVHEVDVPIIKLRTARANEMAGGTQSFLVLPNTGYMAYIEFLLSVW